MQKQVHLTRSEISIVVTALEDYAEHEQDSGSSEEAGRALKLITKISTAPLVKVNSLAQSVETLFGNRGLQVLGRIDPYDLTFLDSAAAEKSFEGIGSWVADEESGPLTIKRLPRMVYLNLCWGEFVGMLIKSHRVWESLKGAGVLKKQLLCALKAAAENGVDH